MRLGFGAELLQFFFQCLMAGKFHHALGPGMNFCHGLRAAQQQYRQNSLGGFIYTEHAGQALVVTCGAVAVIHTEQLTILQFTDTALYLTALIIANRFAAGFLVAGQ